MNWSPFIPPFKYNRDGQWIEDSKGNRLLDLRGWGYLTGQGTEALGMNCDDAARVHDHIGEQVAEALTRSKDKDAIIFKFRETNGMADCTQEHIENMCMSSSDCGKPAKAERFYRKVMNLWK